jgi:hypothetical protein
LTSKKWSKVLSELEAILDYKFTNIKFLKEAIIHDTYYSLHGWENPEFNTINYEKLEVIGDALLDAIVNSTLVKYGIERKISPYEIHHAKANLVNNDVLCKISCFYGIHKFILSGYSKYNIPENFLVDLNEDHAKLEKNDKYPMKFFEELKERKNTFWDHKTNKKKRRKAKGRKFRNKGRLK